MSDNYKEFIQQSESSLNINSIPYTIQSISSLLVVQNNTFINNQPYYINAYLSTVTFDYVIFNSISSDSNVIEISTSNITVSNTQFSNMYNTNTNGLVIFLTSDSQITMTNVTYSDSFMKMIRVYDSKFMISDSVITNIDTMNSDLISVYSSEDTSIMNTMISNITSSSSRIIDVSYSTISSINNVTIEDVYTTIFRMTGSTLNNVVMLKFFNVSQAISMTQTNLTIQDSNFTQCGRDSIVYGGAIDLIDSTISVNNSHFISNYAQSGAAISLR